MEYVMVPVPEHLLENVLQYLHWGLDRPETKSTWDETELRDGLAALDRDARRLLLYAARTNLAGAPTSLEEAATQLGSTSRELLGTLLEINGVLLPPRDGQAVAYTLMTESVTASDSGLSARLLCMDDHMARTVLSMRDPLP